MRILRGPTRGTDERIPPSRRRTARSQAGRLCLTEMVRAAASACAIGVPSSGVVGPRRRPLGAMPDQANNAREFREATGRAPYSSGNPALRRPAK
jgi:hypothetical protein